ncbi:sigma factor-like helix-turn-helix DNA-binding protein [Nocardia beijingensis]|uniref:sigma factor-like helix-turn-helix DNA-binding protein n=1 Tax=Nocardia beijingensis TaxID=95162 RepID=UPI0033C81946
MAAVIAGDELLRRAQRTVASQANDAADCRLLLAMLGLAEVPAAPPRSCPEPAAIPLPEVWKQAAPSPVRRRPRRCRDLEFVTRVAELRELEGRTWAEIAQRLDCSVSTARSAFAQVVVR